MTYTPPDHTPTQWSNAPSRSTPLDKTHLEAAEQDLVDYTKAVAEDLAAKVTDGTVPSPDSVVSGQWAIDLFRGPYNARPGSDATTALTDAIAAILSAGAGLIYFSENGVYDISGPVQSGSGSGTSWAGQLLLPGISYDNPGVSLRIEGPAAPVWAALGNGVVLQSNVASGYVIAVEPGGGATLPYVSALNPDLENLTIICTDASGSGVDFHNSGSCQGRGVILVNTAHPQGNGTVGIAFPPQSNGDWVSWENLGVAGFDTGLVIHEHLIAAGEIPVQECTVAVLCAGGGFPNYFGRLHLVDCPTVFSTVDGGTTIINGDVTWESSGMTSALLIDDPTAALQGSIRLQLNGSAPAKRQSLPAICGPPGFVTPLNIAWADGDASGWYGQHPKDTFLRLVANSPAGGFPGLCSETLTPWNAYQGSFDIAQGTDNGTLTSTNGGSQSLCFLPVLDAARGGRSRSITAIISTGSTGWEGLDVVGQWVNGGAHGSSYIRANVRAANGGDVLLQINGSTVATFTAGIATSTTYTVTLGLTVGADGLPSRARVLLNGSRIVDYWLTATQRATFTGGTNSPALLDGLAFPDDSGSVTGFYVEELGDEEPPTTLATATATHTAMAGETTLCTSGSFTVTLPPPAAGAPPNVVVNSGSGTITIHPPSGALANLSGTTGDITLAQGHDATILTDGTNFFQVT